MTTLNNLDSLDLTSFELFVQRLDELTSFVGDFSSLFIWLLGIEILFVWLIFNYHRQVLKDHKYFVENIDVAGRFTAKTYDMLEYFAIAVVPVGIFVIGFSFFTLFKTKSFIKFFGTRKIKDAF